MGNISVKKIWIATSAWRGYEEPIDALCGANDTGMSSDSPCPSTTREKELGMVKTILRKNRIKFKQTVCRSSNVFCSHVYLCVSKEDKQRAYDLIEPLVHETILLYMC